MEDEEQESQCVICGDKIEYYSIGICNHKEICYYCALKNRIFYNKNKCPLCNKYLDVIYICPKSETKTFKELSQEDLSSYSKDEDSDKIGVYYADISSKEISMNLKAYKCPIDDCDEEESFEEYKDLSDHLEIYHQKFYCELCIKYGKNFISKLNVYSKKEMEEHNLYGNFEEGIPPHYECPFCGDLFYDDEKLSKHMSETYFMCEICKNIDKKLFYSDTSNLVQHNILEHYCCPYEECKGEYSIVFPSKQLLIQHFENEHNQKDENLNEKMANENSPKISDDPTLHDKLMKDVEFNLNDFLEKVKKRCLRHRKKNSINNKIKIKKSNYEYITKYFIDLIKTYIINYIKNNNVKDNKISLPKEIQYQIIMIIEKLNNRKKILELYNIQKLGNGLDKIEKIKNFLQTENYIDENEFFFELDKLSLNNILIVYKYLLTGYKRIIGDFYQLEKEQIIENFYDHFFSNHYKGQQIKKQEEEYYDSSLNQKLNNNNISNNNSKKNKNKFKDNKFTSKDDYGHTQQIMEMPEKDMKKSSGKLIKKYKEEDKKLEKANTNENKEDNKKSHHKSKLAMLLEGKKNSNNNKKISKKSGKFNLSEFNYDEDFPPLK